MSAIVAYRRVSTQKQGASGLGLEAQEAALQAYRTNTGERIVATYTEIESGKRSDRIELAKAISHAKRTKATLVVAKLDRLARNMAFTAALMDSGVEFKACDNPHANRLTIHILAAVAEDEARRISDRTKAALQAAKKRGTLLGSARPGHWAGKEEKRATALVKARAESAKAVRKLAAEAYTDLLPALKSMRARGMTFAQIADQLTLDNHTTRRGKPWNHVQVMRVLKSGI